MKFTNLKHWIRHEIIKNKAYMLLQNTGDEWGDNLVARCCFDLNRHYRGLRVNRQRKWYFYSLKDTLIEKFVNDGFLIDFNRQTKTKSCWHTREYNWGETSHCAKCDNTNIYSQVELYSFTFQFKHLIYKWHSISHKCHLELPEIEEKLQEYSPEFEVAALEITEYVADSLETKRMKPDDILLYEYVISWYTRYNLNRVSFWKSLTQDLFVNFISPACDRIKRFKYWLGDIFRRDARNVAEFYESPKEEEIPF